MVSLRVGHQQRAAETTAARSPVEAPVKVLTAHSPMEKMSVAMLPAIMKGRFKTRFVPESIDQHECSG